jgi:amidohydrolase
MNIIEKIKGLSKDHFQDNVKNRRYLHQNPELSFHEYKTAEFVCQELKNIGIPFESSVAGTGVVALIEGNLDSDSVVGLRADMDALPILEKNEVDYKSKNEGVMHACGHDVHTSSLLGAARILNALKADLQGSIKLIFQPAEEKAPGGASLMIKEGVLTNPGVNCMIGQHVAPNIPVGKIGFREGMYMASTDEIYLKIIGKGGHGAAPHHSIDPVLIASHLVVALQQVISRNRNPAYPSVLSFGRFIADGVTNVIPNEVNIEGTFRCMDEQWREEGLSKIKKIAEGTAEAMGAVCEVYIEKGYPFLKNDVSLTRKIRNSAQNYVGKENIVDLDLWMGGEDFAFYSQQVSSSFYRLGTRNEQKGIVSGVHTPTFDIDENALEIGPGLMAYMAFEKLIG